MLRAYLYQDNSIEFEIKTLLYCNGHRFLSEKGFFDYLISLGLDLDNTDKYIYITFEEIVSKIFDLSKEKVIVKTKLIGDYKTKEKSYILEFGNFTDNRFELNIYELKELIKFINGI